MSIDFIQLANRGVQSLQPYQPGKPIEELQRELGLAEIVKLASNENSLGPSPKALAAMTTALQESCRYPDSSAYLLKQRLAQHLTEESGQAVTAQQVSVGNGSNEILELLARLFLQPGANAVMSQHAFIVYPLVTQSLGAQTNVVAAKDWGHDLAAMAAAIDTNTRMVFIANPNNPTGTWLSAEQIEQFLVSVPDEVIVVVDEAYHEYVLESAYASSLALMDRFPNLVVTRTFSKAYGMAAQRIGYCVSNSQIADLLNRIREPFNVNSIALAGATAALDDPAHIQNGRELNRQGMKQITAACQRLGLAYIPSAGNFIALEFDLDVAAAYQHMLSLGVIVRPVGVYQMPNHLRVSIGLAEENQRFIDVLQQTLSDLS